MKRLVLLPFFAVILACSAQTVQPTVDLSAFHGQTYVSCTDKRDGSHLDYLETQKTDYQSTIINTVTISNVIDIRGQHWVINSNEWTNFTCAKQIVP